MSTWYEATEANVEAANNAMAEVATYRGLDEGERAERIRAIWEPVANALFESVREDLEENWPDEAALANSLEGDFVGQTSDTGKIVSWGADGPEFRPFKIHQSWEGTK